MNEIIKGLSKNLLEENPEIEARIKHGIELHRKGTAKFTLLGKDGTEIRNAEIELKQTKHQFEFRMQRIPDQPVQGGGKECGA